MRTIFLILLCLIGSAAGFTGTLWLLDGQAGLPLSKSTSTSGGKATRKPALTVLAEPGRVGAGTTVVLRPVQGGMELKSTFNAANGAVNVDGAAYLSVEGPQLPVISGRKIIVELEASAAPITADHKTEIQFVQNGLGQSGWKSFPVKAGRQEYRFEYAAPTDDRSPSKVDTFWIRSDASGQGQPLTVHAVHLYVD